MGRPRSATTGFVGGAPGYRPLQGGPEPTRGRAQVRDLEDLRAEEDTAPIKLRTCCGVPTFRVIAAFLVVGGLAVLALLVILLTLQAQVLSKLPLVQPAYVLRQMLLMAHTLATSI